MGYYLMILGKWSRNASKRSRIDMNQPQQPCQPQPLEFNTEIINKIFVELAKVICFRDPYDNENTCWQDDGLWNTIIERLQLPMKVWIDDFKVTVLGYYEMYQKGTLSTLDLTDGVLEISEKIFKRQRPNIGEYLRGEGNGSRDGRKTRSDGYQ